MQKYQNFRIAKKNMSVTDILDFNISGTKDHGFVIK